MVADAAVDRADMQARAWEAAAAVPDPEVPCVTVADLGILRSVEIDGALLDADQDGQRRDDLRDRGDPRLGPRRRARRQ